MPDPKASQSARPPGDAPAGPAATLVLGGDDLRLAHAIADAAVAVRPALTVAADLEAALERDGASVWDLHVAGQGDAAATLAQLRHFAEALPAPRRGGIVLVLDIRHWQPRAADPVPPFGPTLALRTLCAAVPLLALEFAPRLRVNAIGIAPETPSNVSPLPADLVDDIAATLRFIIDAPALTGQMIALDGGRTALVPGGTSQIATA